MNYFKDAAQLSSVFKKAWQKRENYIERGSLQAFRLITKEELDVPMAVDIYGYDAKPCAVMQQYDFDISDYDLDLLEEILRSEYGVVEIFYKKRFRVKDSPDAGG